MRITTTRGKEVYNTKIISNAEINLANFNGQSLEDYTFKNCELYGATFHNAKLKNIRFEHCNLCKCNFKCAQIHHCSIVDCYAISSHFNYTTIKNSDIYSSNFSLSDFSNSVFKSCNIGDINLRNATLKYSILPHNSHDFLSEVLRQNANFVEQEIIAAYIKIETYKCWYDFLALELPETPWAIDTIWPYLGLTINDLQDKCWPMFHYFLKHKEEFIGKKLNDKEIYNGQF